MDGYTSHERYAVVWRHGRRRITFELVRTRLGRPFRKRYPHAVDAVRRYRQFVGMGWSLGAYEGARLVGLAVAEPRPAEGSVFVWELGVDPAYRRQGVATRLLDALVRRARTDGYRAVVCETQTTNVPAIDFYRAVGFRPEGVNLSEYSNEDLRTGEIALFMKKRLAPSKNTTRARRARRRNTSK